MKQIIVPIEDHPGAAADLAKLLGDAQINIETLNTRGNDEHGVVILTVDQYDRALMVLSDGGYEAVSEDALLIRIEDEPGSLAKVAQRFKDADLNIRSIRIVARQPNHSLVAIVAQDTEKARELVKDLLVE